MNINPLHLHIYTGSAHVTSHIATLAQCVPCIPPCILCTPDPALVRRTPRGLCVAQHLGIGMELSNLSMRVAAQDASLSLLDATAQVEIVQLRELEGARGGGSFDGMQPNVSAPKTSGRRPRDQTASG